MSVFDDLRKESESKRIINMINWLKNYNDFRNKQIDNLEEFLRKGLNYE